VLPPAPRPNGKPPYPAQLKRDEFKEVPCSGCGSTWRRVVGGFCRFLVHRLDPRVSGPENWEWHFCVGCGKQVTLLGQVVEPGAEGAVPPEILKEMNRA